MKHCLIVDDSSVVRKVARRIMEDLNFIVSEAEDGAEGLAICRQSMPDVILLDWSMPVMDGIEFLAKLRQDESGGDRPKVVFCTSEYDVAQIAKAVRAGADDFLMKPFDRGLVEAKLQEVGAL
jgi:two-component system chemotaxis response regulator CheY